MEYQKFLEYVEAGINKYVEEGTSVAINQVMKNNAVSKDALIILEQGINISPTIYLNSFFNELEQGRPLGDILSDIIKLYEENRVINPINMDFFADYEKVRGKIVYKIINYERNRELLEKIPYIPYLDLAIVFYCLLISDNLGNTSALIYKTHQDIWDVTTGELYEAAKENTPFLLQPKISSMKEVILEMFKEAQEENEEIELLNQVSLELSNEDKNHTMFVLSNQTRTSGAACILYPGVLQEFANLYERDVIILPSSIHEVILLPRTGNEELSEIGAMVHEINTTQIDVEDLLSDRIYLYSKMTGEIA